MCKHDDAALIEKLWMSLIYRYCIGKHFSIVVNIWRNNIYWFLIDRIVPGRSNNTSIQKCLDEKRKASLLGKR
jgi:hypothetical protein